MLPALYCDEIAGLKSYPKTNSWKEGTDCCSWDGVSCDHLNAHVIALCSKLSCSWLFGNFPSNTSLFLLPHLQKLNLAFNNFNHSKIPSEFGRFTGLHYLNLSHTGFVGVVPSQVSHLSKLVSLDLSWIDEQLTIDKYALEGLVHNLTELRHLFLDGIDMFSINPHVFMNLSSSLRSLSLDSCDLQGKFPKNIFDFPNLNLLNLRGNRNLNLDLLKFDRGSNLEHLDLSRMSFSTEWINSIDNLGLKVLRLPESIGNLVSLKFLDLSHSNLSGPIPRSLGNLLQLTHLDLGWNKLSGQILFGHIKEFQSKSLEYLYLKNNKLQGPLPSSIFQLLNLTSLSLSSNNLTGVREFSMFSNLPNLELLDLSYNSLSLTSNSTSSVNHIILPNLTDLSLSSCNLSEFPQFLKELKSLRGLDLSYNRIECKIPRWMQEVRNDSLRYLNVSHNSLTKVEQFPWKNIGTLDLSFNLIVGNLLIPASTINVFFVSNNNFNGEVSTLICNASALRILDFSHNNLSVTIPQCFGNLSNSLEFLNLKKNKFYGTIPPTFAKGCQLSNLNLNGNLLKEPLTPSILNCRGMEVLDLGNNKINDTFLHWLGSLSFLQVLVLKSNHMHGSLRVNSSNSSPFFSKIQIFDLSSNYFSGPLPVTYINSFKAIINLEKKGIARPYMGVQDYTSGFYAYSIGIIMEGQYMELVKIFTMWMISDLSNNQFEGEIPKLDLSSNRLSRTIPNRLVDLAFLSSLSVSENQLHGQIPQGKQFYSYEGNKGLCGFPVSKDCNIIELPPPNVLEKDGSKSNIAFGWKVVLISYGCGVVFGMAVGYVAFQIGKPKWFVNLVEN
ncbi:hypothetical protein ES288_D05G452300v1 [Gossypium darwinii]|uniref:Leucine-rich repeat-containing N-terminal plant-type domain-containing protein n=1 Tax=Gossypium darwinii TaxID=34276 RepID=A0A5D2CTZ5_GOSDA|nr:hypothetical protein ES288_D05G452300v1 [Gossypium darwinii]